MVGRSFDPTRRGGDLTAALFAAVLLSESGQTQFSPDNKPAIRWNIEAWTQIHLLYSH